MKKYLILACILLQYAIMLDQVWAADAYPYVNWGGNNRYFTSQSGSWGGSSYWDGYYIITNTDQTYYVNYNNSDRASYASSVTGGIGLWNYTTNTYTIMYDLCAVRDDFGSAPVFVNSGGDDTSSYFFNTSGWTEYLQSNSMHISTFPRNQANNYINSTSDFWVQLDYSAMVSDLTLVGSILVNDFGIQDEYSVNDFGSALNDFCAGLFGVDALSSTGQISTLSPSQGIYTGDTYYWRVYGANQNNNIATFGILDTSYLASASAADLMNLYNSNTGSGWTLYTEEELNTIFEVLPYDGDISLGTGSTNNFKELLIYLFKPSYTGIEDNYNDLVNNLGILYMPIDYINCILGTISGTYDRDMVLSWDNINVFGITLSGDTFRFTPSDILPSSMSSFWTVFQYFAMFVVLMGLTIHTYRHLFSSNGEEGGSAI